MTNPCPKCGKNLDLVGKAHICKQMTVGEFAQLWRKHAYPLNPMSWTCEHPFDPDCPRCNPKVSTEVLDTPKTVKPLIRRSNKVKPTFDRKAYMKEYMRKKRAKDAVETNE